MKYFLPPFSLRARDKRVLALIRKGSCTDDELFEAQYGEWPVRGLDKDTPRDEIIHFKGFGDDKNWDISRYIFSQGYIREETPEREMFINRMMVSPLGHALGILTTRMAWARLHDVAELAALETGVAGLAFLGISLTSSYRYAIASSLVKMIAPSLSDIAGEEQMHVRQFKDDSNPVLARRAFQAVATDMVGNRGGLSQQLVQLAQAVDVVLTLMPSGHYSQDHEQQAQLHNLMVRGYPAWGRLPRNHEEFYAALYDMGIKAPPVVGRHLHDGSNKHLRDEFFKHSRFSEGFISPPSAEMNIGLNSHRSKAVLSFYWSDVLPFLYADLLQKYGDSTGYDKMKYTHETDIMGLPLRKPKAPGTPAP